MLTVSVAAQSFSWDAESLLEYLILVFSATHGGYACGDYTFSSNSYLGAFYLSSIF